AGAAGAIRRLHAVAAGGSGRRGRWLERAGAAAGVLGRTSEGSAGSDRSSVRPFASCGCEPPGRYGRGVAVRGTAWLAAQVGARQRCEPVHGVAGGALWVDWAG